MSTFSFRQRILQTIDEVATKLPQAYMRLPRNDHHETLSPFLAALRHLRQLATPRNAASLSAQAVRERFHKDLLSLRVDYPVRAVKEVMIPSPSGVLHARHYLPTASDALPVLLVYFHGGGFVFGDLDTHDDACRLLCQESGMPVLSVAYRLAPEHPFPAAVEDAEIAVHWALDNAAHFGVDAIAVGGDSAGGNLATVTAQALAASGRPLLAQLLIYPGTDRTTSRLSHRLFGEGFFLNSAERESNYHHYLAGQQSLGADPRVSPLLNKNPSILAPTLMVTAGFDMLRDEGDVYAEHLKTTGTSVTLLYFARLGHGFINLASVHGESKAAVRHIAQQWRQLCQHSLTRGITP